MNPWSNTHSNASPKQRLLLLFPREVWKFPPGEEWRHYFKKTKKKKKNKKKKNKKKKKQKIKIKKNNIFFKILFLLFFFYIFFFFVFFNLDFIKSKFGLFFLNKKKKELLGLEPAGNEEEIKGTDGIAGIWTTALTDAELHSALIFLEEVRLTFLFFF